MSAPIACTLTGNDFRDRIAWIAELNRTALRTHQRNGLTLVLAYDREAEERVRDLMAREQLCCAFLSFALDPEGDLIRLTITAPENARIAADMIFDQFVSANTDPVISCGCR